ncbi:SLC13 family permease [Caloramator sp. mosi_1]|uniref:SLC13 family permease n=1 Tax=Caloramator sp. mosi_1 TaxID=3023090 RepID=UPI003081401C
MPAAMADFIVDKVGSVKWVIISLSLFAGVVSAFIDNVATVLIIAPVALNLARRINISPVYMLIAISISSNLQGAATLVGDTTSLLLGGFANMDFLDFFFLKEE